MLKFDIITIFPEIFDSYFKESILGRAQKEKKIAISIHNLRDYAPGAHRVVDESPYGGGAGMVMKVEPIWKAVQSLKSKVKSQKSKLQLKKSKSPKEKIILLSAKGKQFDQQMARRLSKLDRIILICGRYEGVDERVAKYVADEEISVGPYVLTGGEIPAMSIVDAAARLVPGVLGNKESLKEESFSSPNGGTKTDATVEYPHYTRPEVFMPKKGVRWIVPKVLLSGDHKKIAEWRAKFMNQ
jgi:tRNA (guanine37-N1)-methyltransferase